MADDSRRGVLKVATVAIGGAIGAVLGFPLVRYLLYPVGRRVVSSSGEPVDAGAAPPEGATAPVRMQITADEQRDAWAVATQVPLGAAWVSRRPDGSLRAFSTTCPHLGCAVDYDAEAGTYKCPCHTSAFAPDGSKLSGPAKRGLDELPVEQRGDRVFITFKRFRTDIAEREEA